MESRRVNSERKTPVRITFIDSSQEREINNDLFGLLVDISHDISGMYEGKGSQKGILLYLMEVKTASQKMIAEHFNIKPASVSETVTKLEKNGYVEKVQSSDDKRSYNISITGKGESFARDIRISKADKQKRLFKGLENEEKLQLIDMLKKMR